MEDSKSFSSMVEEDLEHGSTGGSDSEKGERLGISDRCFSFSTIYQPTQNKPKAYPKMQTLLLAYQSIGVVYGDLGTSPTQVLSSITVPNLTEEDFLAIFSLIFWSLTLLSLVKYVFIVLYADDNGEGGTFALYSNLCRHINFQTKHVATLESKASMIYYSRGSFLGSKIKKFIERSPVAQSVITFVVLLGTCMVIGDGALTPATCVLSALQGVQSSSPKITQEYVVLMAVLLFVILFAFQRCGTSRISFCFSPIMLLWYAANVTIGFYNIITYYPSVLKAISPHYIFKLFLRNGKTGWDVLGAVFLCVSGVEALFADLGHFNRRAMQLAYSFIVYPAMVITYAGEAAYLIKNPNQISTAYYSSIPNPVYWPMFVVSNLAAVVSSQSMISASFSIVKQSLVLDCFPRVTMIHTSSKHEGQVYSPEINYTLMVLCIGLVVGFKGSFQLANAYGAVVIWVMIITTCLTTLVMLVIWETNVLLVLGFFFVFIGIEGIFMSSLLNKIPHGGWVPFAISAFFLTVMLSWRYGRRKKTIYEAERKMSLSELDQILSRGTVCRTPGICFFYTDLINGIPPIIRQYIQHTSSVHEIMVIVTVRTLPIRSVLPEERFIVGKLGNEEVYSCYVQFGYNDLQSSEGEDHVDSVVAKLREQAENINEKEKIDLAAEKGVVCVTGRTILKSNQDNRWVSRFTINYLYRFIQKNCRSAISTLEVPPEKTMQVGMQYEI